MFSTLRKSYPGNRYVDRAFIRYREATTPNEARAGIDYLQSSYLRYPIDANLGLPAAGAGTYQLKLQVGDAIYLGSLEVREDPLLED